MKNNRLFLFAFWAAAGFLLLPAFSAPSRQDCPYIFYWGLVQSRFTFDEASGRYQGEIHTSLNEFSNAIKREPRIWDGQALRPECSFLLGDLRVESKYYAPGVYDSIRPKILELSQSWNDSTVVLIDQITLPDNRTGVIKVIFSVKEEFIKANAMRIPVPGDGGSSRANPGYMQWGTERFDDKSREFFTPDEFWNIVDAEPLWFSSNGRVLRPEQWEFAVNNLKGFHVYRKNSGGRLDQFSLAELRSQLRNMENDIQPGTAIDIYAWDTASATIRQPVTDTLFLLNSPVAVTSAMIRLADGTMVSMEELGRIRVASFTLVDDGDPRVSLHRSDRKNFTFLWGAYEFNFLNVHDQTFLKIDGSPLRGQRQMATTKSLSRSEILDMFHKQAVLLDINKQTVEPLSFNLRYHDRTIRIENGKCPPEAAEQIEKELKKYETLTISDMRAGKSDLGFAEFILDVRADDNKTLLYPSYAPLNNPPDKQLRLLSTVFDHSTSAIKVEFYLPEAGEVAISMRNIDGTVVASDSKTFPKGNNKTELPMVSGANDSRIITLAAHGLTVQQQYFPER